MPGTKGRARAESHRALEQDAQQPGLVRGGRICRDNRPGAGVILGLSGRAEPGRAAEGCRNTGRAGRMSISSSSDPRLRSRLLPSRLRRFRHPADRAGCLCPRQSHRRVRRGSSSSKSSASPISSRSSSTSADRRKRGRGVAPDAGCGGGWGYHSARGQTDPDARGRAYRAASPAHLRSFRRPAGRPSGARSSSSGLSAEPGIGRAPDRAGQRQARWAPAEIGITRRDEPAGQPLRCGDGTARRVLAVRPSRAADRAASGRAGSPPDGRRGSSSSSTSSSSSSSSRSPGDSRFSLVGERRGHAGAKRRTQRRQGPAGGARGGPAPERRAGWPRDSRAGGFCSPAAGLPGAGAADASDVEQPSSQPVCPTSSGASHPSAEIPLNDRLAASRILPPVPVSPAQAASVRQRAGRQFPSQTIRQTEMRQPPGGRRRLRARLAFPRRGWNTGHPLGGWHRGSYRFRQGPGQRRSDPLVGPQSHPRHHSPDRGGG
jgi:hypothetical protein